MDASSLYKTRSEVSLAKSFCEGKIWPWPLDQERIKERKREGKKGRRKKERKGEERKVEKKKERKGEKRKKGGRKKERAK
jgi:hypothetical protein